MTIKSILGRSTWLIGHGNTSSKYQVRRTMSALGHKLKFRGAIGIVQVFEPVGQHPPAFL
jgi:hypothetical protein